MRIQHNIAALNSHRNLMGNNSAVGKNLEKLSSGYRINRAGDDAAGLAISEKMRAQITGLQTAQKNAEDGVSLVQTAEGALTEVHSMLNRMVELATQSANGTYSDKNREEMQKEVDELKKEIDRISNTANFNGTTLFSAGAANGVETAAATDPVITVGNGLTATPGTPATIGTITDATALSATGASNTYDVEYTDAEGKTQTVSVSYTEDSSDVGASATAAADALNADTAFSKLFTAQAGADGKVTITAKDTGDTGITVTKLNSQAVTWTAGADAVPTKIGGTLANGSTVTVDGKTYTMKDTDPDATKGEFADEAGLKKLLEDDGYTVSGTLAGNDFVITKADNNADAGNGVTISLHVGESSAPANTIDINIEAMSSATLGSADAKIADLDIQTADGAKDAIDTVNAAIDQVSSIRSSLGAMQNRLEHTINNLGVQTENITAAESRIRDVDMAKEMMAYTKNNILVQASQAMLAQANQVPQGVLQLLQ